MAAKDEDIPKLGSVPPEGEADEVTRVGSRDEIQRALENESKQVDLGPRGGNNLPTPPAPPPSDDMKAALKESTGIRLAPPPADLAGDRTNDMPTKPPTAGVVDNVDIDAAFTDTSLDELDSSALEPAPPSAIAAKPLAPPLPPAAKRKSATPPASPETSTSTSDAPAFPATSEPMVSRPPQAAASLRPEPTLSTAPDAGPLAERSSLSSQSNPRTMLAMLLVVGAVIAAFFAAAMLSR